MHILCVVCVHLCVVCVYNVCTTSVCAFMMYVHLRVVCVCVMCAHLCVYDMCTSVCACVQCVHICVCDMCMMYAHLCE